MPTRDEGGNGKAADGVTRSAVGRGSASRFASASACLLVAACGGRVMTTPANDDAGRTYSDEEKARACDGYFDAGGWDALVRGPKYVPEPEMERRRARFRRHCLGRFDRPHSAYTVPALAACTEAFALGTDHLPLACNFRGTLAPRTACTDDAQCKTGACYYDFVYSVGGGKICSQLPSDPTLTESGAGAACDRGAIQCKPGLYCDRGTSTCTPFVDTGGPCPNDAFCKVGLTCVGNPPTCEPDRALGAECSTEFSIPPLVAPCAAGLACAGSQCAPATWLEPGEPCDGEGGPNDPSHPNYGICLKAFCRWVNLPPLSTCQIILNDGDACVSPQGAPQDPSVCDYFSSCLDGVCTPT